MAIQATGGKLHWNYFLALERDLEGVSRYVEFAKPNFAVYSIELAHLLFAAASEVDVIAKLVCDRVDAAAPANNINEYKPVLLKALPDLPTTNVFIPRYGITLAPWDNWNGANNPDWWRSYNNVKHERDAHFEEATLKNALNALGALLILTFHHYSYQLGPGGTTKLGNKDTTEKLLPDSTLLRLPDAYYHDTLIV